MLGAHLSIAGGLHNALLTAERLSLDTVQVFTANPRTFHYASVQRMTKNQQQWAFKPLRPSAVALWTEHAKRLGFDQTISHDSYLINLASPHDFLWRRSTELVIEEYARCAALRIPFLVMHPGAHMDTDERRAFQRVAAALDAVFARFPRGRVLVCLEITAGQGSAIGYRLEHLAEIIGRSRSPQRLAVCLDTAHLFASGYDFRGRKYDSFMNEVDRIIGLDRIRVIHFNDSKRELGSRVDRHEHIGRGRIGLRGFRPFLEDQRFAAIPKVIETPKEKHPSGREWDEVNIETLRRLLP